MSIASLGLGWVGSISCASSEDARHRSVRSWHPPSVSGRLDTQIKACRQQNASEVDLLKIACFVEYQSENPAESNCIVFITLHIC